MVDPFDGEALPATGTAHGHVRLRDGRLARIAYAHEGDASAAGRLHAQAAAFRHLEPAGRTPHLHEVIEPRAGLPGGALIVDFIEGRAPRLPDELGLMADTLARIHALPLPPASSPIARQGNPFLETLEGIELNAMRFLDKAVTDPGARADIADELRAMRRLVPALGRKVQPLTVALADTHPGNFIVDSAGIAWFVDLEKVHVGSPAIDLAHATLPTSTLWHPDVGKRLTGEEVRGFYESYLPRIGAQKAEALRPWLAPMRRLTWLRTTLFMARWRVETRSPRDPSNPGQWSSAGLDARMKAHIDARIDECFSPSVVRAIRATISSDLTRS
ncbi:MAG: aminoglycoside phosphotransferase family protein [Proteobacteria bacterium]|nr:aminoglycoside phosphotransferase family protein [Pseudomonadota bacterium]